MTTYSKKTDRMDLYVNDKTGTILVQLKWKYSWATSKGTKRWTFTEKAAFHQAADKLIWQIWSDKITLNVGGSSELAKKYKSKGLKVNFDIRWVISGAHWDVSVTKIPVGKFKGSSVNWNKREATLDTEDINPVVRKNAGKSHTQYPVAHEFGHAVGNSIFASSKMHGDEYKQSSSYFSDKSSIMNIGSQIRKRHIDYILSQLNGMIPNTVFSKQ